MADQCYRCAQRIRRRIQYRDRKIKRLKDVCANLMVVLFLKGELKSRGDSDG
jgi:hypothetical protein